MSIAYTVKYKLCIRQCKLSVLVMSFRAQVFNTLMACGMKLSLSLVVWYRQLDSSSQNSVWLWRLASCTAGVDDPHGLLLNPGDVLWNFGGCGGAYPESAKKEVLTAFLQCTKHNSIAFECNKVLLDVHGPCNVQLFENCLRDAFIQFYGHLDAVQLLNCNASYWEVFLIFCPPYFFFLSLRMEYM